MILPPLVTLDPAKSRHQIHPAGFYRIYRIPHMRATPSSFLPTIPRLLLFLEKQRPPFFFRVRFFPMMSALPCFPPTWGDAHFMGLHLDRAFCRLTEGNGLPFPGPTGPDYRCT